MKSDFDVSKSEVKRTSGGQLATALADVNTGSWLAANQYACGLFATAVLSPPNLVLRANLSTFTKLKKHSID